MSNTNQQEEKEVGELLGKKLAMYIAVLPTDDAVKQKMLDAVRLMTQSEAAEFCAELDALYAGEATKDLDAKQLATLEKIKAKYNKKREKVLQSSVTALADLEKELDSIV